MASKFSQFLADNKLDQRRILAASRNIEKLRPADRRLRLAKRSGKAAAASAGEAPDEKVPEKPRSGRPITKPLLNNVLAGKPVAGPAKTRLLRAVNHVLAQKKKDPVDLRALF